MKKWERGTLASRPAEKSWPSAAAGADQPATKKGNSNGHHFNVGENRHRTIRHHNQWGRIDIEELDYT